MKKIVITLFLSVLLLCMVSCKKPNVYTPNFTLAEGYVLDTVEVLDAEGNAVELDGLKFAIPAGGVTVNATFKLAQ